jgi:hypothetical protein
LGASLQLRGIAKSFGIAAASLVIEVDVLPNDPTQLLQALRKRCEASLYLGVIRREDH